ncbi:MAG: hypothetical protein U9N31_06225 [Candidatus Marinimicrobia bacterium]|nr:hypothetical protein [Candidatus Neomarinimicrobiota bacterium]
MNSKLFKTFSLLLGGMIVFTACDDDPAPVHNGDVVGTWNLSGLTGTYNRKVVTGSGIEHSADSYNLVASWDDAAGFAAATGADPAVVTGATNQTMATWAAGMDAPGFPLTSTSDAAALAAVGVVMKGVFDDAPSKGAAATYKITGTYPSIQLNTETCTPYRTIPQINDQGNYTLTFDATDAAGTIALSPATDLDQVLPPFPDGKFTVDGDAGKLTIDFLDRDNSSSRYSEVMAAWSEADDRVISGLSQLPVNTAGGFFTSPADPGAGALASSAYIAVPALAPWGGYLTWYAFNISAEASVKAADVKNPLTDLDGDGSLTAVDMIIYMHADNLAGGGTVSAFGIPYTMLVDSSNPAAPAAVNDSATDFALAGLATASGGKMKYTILNGLCMPVDETIEFKSQWTAAE